MIWKMPESLSFLVEKNAAAAKIRTIINKISPHLANENSRYTVGEPVAKAQSALGLVVSKPYFLGTMMLWLAYFTVLLFSIRKL